MSITSPFELINVKTAIIVLLIMNLAGQCFCTHLLEFYDISIQIDIPTNCLCKKSEIIT